MCGPPATAGALLYSFALSASCGQGVADCVFFVCGGDVRFVVGIYFYSGTMSGQRLNRSGVQPQYARLLLEWLALEVHGDARYLRQEQQQRPLLQRLFFGDGGRE